MVAPNYSIVKIRKLTMDEFVSVENQSVQYIQENAEGNGIVCFNIREAEEYKDLQPCLLATKLYSNELKLKNVRDFFGVPEEYTICHLNKADEFGYSFTFENEKGKVIYKEASIQETKELITKEYKHYWVIHVEPVCKLDTNAISTIIVAQTNIPKTYNKNISEVNPGYFRVRNTSVLKELPVDQEIFRCEDNEKLFIFTFEDIKLKTD